MWISLDLNRSKGLCNLFSWGFKINEMMAWWHDAMQMKAKKNATSKNKSHNESRKPWKASEASVSGHYNTPPLQEDLVPRSRMAPERNGRRIEEVKLSCFSDKWVKPKNLERLKSWKKEHNGVEHNWEHCGRKIETRNTIEPWRLQSYEWRVQWTRRNWTRSSSIEINKEQGRTNSDNTPVEKRCKTW